MSKEPTTTQEEPTSGLGNKRVQQAYPVSDREDEPVSDREDDPDSDREEGSHSLFLASYCSDPDDEYCDLEESIARGYQRRVHGRALGFRHNEYYGTDDEERTCIWSGGDPFSWTEPTSGISWIGVNGTDASFVVSLSHEPVPPAGRIQLKPYELMYPALCDMGVLADTSTAFTEFRRTMITRSSPNKVGPFAVVAAAPGTVAEDHPGSIYGAKAAIKFLTEKVEGRSYLSYKEIRQMAVCALKYLLGPKFVPDVVFKDSGEIEDVFEKIDVEGLLAVGNALQVEQQEEANTCHRC